VVSNVDYQDCVLCEWRCGVNRLEGELGVCRMGLPQVASCMLHAAPPESYTIFMAGCNFRCLHCQNFDIAHFPDTKASIQGPRDACELAGEGVRALRSAPGVFMGADRLFFSGGESTCSLPFVEQVVTEARRLNPGVKVNFDTNGFATPEAFERILSLADSITFDIRAIDDQLHRAMTGAPSQPVLRNAASMAAHSEQLWEYRVLVVPEINQDELEPICAHIASLDPSLPVAFLAFRPNFVLEEHPGAGMALMQQAVEIARDCGLSNAEWHGHPGLPGRSVPHPHDAYQRPDAGLAGAYAHARGCPTHPRLCGDCPSAHDCPVKQHRPNRRL
jgi:pyruvate formate lyase activating enzyme